VLLLRACNRSSAPWRNGRGVTREVAVWPPDAGPDGFDWRISTADLTAPAPFSVLPGVDRVVLMLDGAVEVVRDGWVLRIPRGKTLSFAGESEVSARPISGTSRDLGVMTRRGRFEADLSVIRVRGRVSLAADDGESLAVVAVSGRMLAAGHDIGDLDAVLSHGPIDIEGHSGAPDAAEAAVIRLRRHG
jgi:environmental stress-induced protein Ves